MRQARLTAGLVATVVFLTAIAPLATDMYVPAFPQVAGELSASATQVQLTLTTFFVGMALGQLIGGPVSDQRGRRIPLLAALLAMTVASIVCALAPTIGVMTVARLVQGFMRRLGDGDRAGDHRRPGHRGTAGPRTERHRRGRRHRTDRRPAPRRAHPATVAVADLVLARRSARPGDDLGGPGRRARVAPTRAPPGRMGYATFSPPGGSS